MYQSFRQDRLKISFIFDGIGNQNKGTDKQEEG
jgi:hypothetical protein